MKRTFVPKQQAPLNIDLHEYVRPHADKAVLKFSYFYACVAGLCIIALILKEHFIFVKQYMILIEVMAAILLFLSGKNLFSYLKTESNLFKWNLTAASIKEITETEQGHSIIKLEFYPNNSDKMEVTEEFHYPIIDEIEQLGLNSLPMMYQPIRYTHGAYFIDLRFIEGKLVTKNLRTINN